MSLSLLQWGEHLQCPSEGRAQTAECGSVVTMDRGEDRVGTDNYLHLPQLCRQPHCSVSGGLIGTIIHHAERQASFGRSRDARYTLGQQQRLRLNAYFFKNVGYRICIFQS